MTVEVANYISNLNKSYPRNRDLIKEGDDHIRLVKSVLQNTLPGFDSALTATSGKINQLDATFTYDADKITINTSLELGKDKKFNMGGAKLENVGDATEPTDAINLRSLQGSLMWPIGSIFMTVDSRNPKEILGFGNWEKFAAGRVVVGTGTTTDINNETRTVVNEAKGGAYQAKLTNDQLPEHTHTGTGTAESAGSHGHTFANGGGSSGPRQAVAIDSSNIGEVDFVGNKIGGKNAVDMDGIHTHKVTVTSEKTGKGQAFDIVPPYIACNIWVRRADTVTP
ncbi:MAG: phage baseplate protein [Fusobacteriaceae bacterium]